MTQLNLLDRHKTAVEKRDRLSAQEHMVRCTGTHMSNFESSRVICDFCPSKQTLIRRVFVLSRISQGLRLTTSRSSTIPYFQFIYLLDMTNGKLSFATWIFLTISKHRSERGVFMDSVLSWRESVFDRENHPLLTLDLPNFCTTETSKSKSQCENQTH